MAKATKYLDWVSSILVGAVALIATNQADILANIPEDQKYLALAVSIIAAVWNFLSPGFRARDASSRGKTEVENELESLQLSTTSCDAMEKIKKLKELEDAQAITNPEFLEIKQIYVENLKKS